MGIKKASGKTLMDLDLDGGSTAATTTTSSAPTVSDDEVEKRYKQMLAKKK
eukprot:NODE_3099_length_412_cov_89.796143_g2477_i0.p5 GENE.NODE_3099_length_412_cov_89.796143_g2477_i0~~NODE_3099_length_412_cov_89.796143_g2477_i0.p5  ORF type:complete len:51 (-),score=17.92 NODE_3099_length_412_cov_89.796143_g2477_i0:232-384(-)